jgi:hypothetical protein
MTTSISIELPGSGVIATIDYVVHRGELTSPPRKGVKYTGRVAVNRIPLPLLNALREYREIADDQVLSLLDEAHARVLDFKLRARVTPDGPYGNVTDFQLYDEKVTVVIDFPAPAQE